MWLCRTSASDNLLLFAPSITQIHFSNHLINIFKPVATTAMFSCVYLTQVRFEPPLTFDKHTARFVSLSSSLCFSRRCLLRRPCCRAAGSKFATFFSGFVLRRGTRSWIPGSTSYSDVPYWNASTPGWNGPAAPSSACTRPFPPLSASSHAARWEERSDNWKIQTDPNQMSLCQNRTPRSPLNRLKIRTFTSLH